MSELKIEVGKFYKTRDGNKVRIYTTDRGGRYPIHGAIFDGRWINAEWEKTGQYADWVPLSSADIVAEWDEEV